MTNERSVIFYNWAIGFISLLFLCIITAVYGFALTNGYLLLFIFFADLIINNFRIVIQKVETSLSTIIEMACFLTYGIVAAAWVAFLSSLLTEGCIKKKPFRVVCLNSGICIISMLTGSFAYNMASDFFAGKGSSSFHQVLPCIFFGIFYIITGYAILSFEFIITDKRMLKDMFTKNLAWEIVSLVLSIPASIEFAHIYGSTQSTLLAPLFMLAVILLCLISYMVERMVFANKQLRELSKVALTINSNLDIEVIYNSVFDTIYSMVSFEGCYIFDLDKGNNQLMPVAYRINEFKNPKIYGVDINKSIFKKTVDSAKAVVISDLKSETAGYNSGSEYYSIYQSCILVPMRRLNQYAGCIGIFGCDLFVLDKSILEFLTILSEQAIIAMENARLFKSSEEEAITDNLTYLYNQRYFYDCLNRKIKDYQEGEGKMSLIMLDIDHFKDINDSYGHISGDYVLKEVAALIKSCVRKNDTVARYGGEEFTVILPDIDADGAFIIADRIREKIQNHVFLINGHNIRTTISGGVAEYPKYAQNAIDLVSYADRAMYIGAKFSGRNKVMVYSGNIV